MKAKRIPPAPGQESAWDYPRPPKLEATDKRVQVLLAGQTVADSTRVKRVLETYHPPVYYIPLEDVNPSFLHEAKGSSFCEWKGLARYFDIMVGDVRRERAAWSYPEPLAGFEIIKGHLAFYAQLMDGCLVAGESVMPQPGNFYGGWITSDVVGPFKGEPGTQHW